MALTLADLEARGVDWLVIACDRCPGAGLQNDLAISAWDDQ
jgi:hypothetical protein